MLLTSDKLDKSDLEYDLMKEEKLNLIPEAKLEYFPPKSRKSHIFSCIILVLLVSTAALWLMPTFNYNIYTNTRNYDAITLPNTIKTVNEATAVLNKIKDSVSLISENNTEMALQYVEAIQDMLQDRTRMAVLKINQIVTDKIREIENEITSFDYVITEASGGIVDYTIQDMKSLREIVSSTTNATYRTDLENIFKTVEEKVTSAFDDLDSMYTFYGSYMGDIIEHKVNNATDRISKIINSNRRYCECTIQEKVNFCYTISTQNVKISSQLESLVKVIGILNNTTDILDTLEPTLIKSDNKDSCNLFTEARTVLNKALADSETLLDTILKDDSCFLGSAVRKTAYKNHEQQKQLILNSFEASIQSLATNLNTTTTGFKVVQEKHRKEVEQDITNAITALANEIRAKANELPASALDEYEERYRASFADMQSYMDNKFQNVTNVINPMFEERQKQIAEGLKYTLQFITFQQVPFISTLSVNNYLSTDVCPLSTDYQTFIAITLNQCLDPVEGNAVKQLTASSAAFAKENDNDTFDFIQDDKDKESADNENQNNQNSENNQNNQNVEPTESSDLSTDSLVQVLGSFVEDILNGDSDSSDSQQPVVEVVITDYEMDEDENNGIQN